MGKTAGPNRFPLLVLRGRIWAAILRVPVDVRGILGRSVFAQSTGEEDPIRAMVKARPWIDKWKKQIKDVRAGKSLADQDLIMAVTRRLASHVRSEPGVISEEMDGALRGIASRPRH
jgi:hypothetical protein